MTSTYQDADGCACGGGEDGVARHSKTCPIVPDNYIPIETIEGDEIQIGLHLYRRDVKGDGRMRCVFCGCGYVAIPKHVHECDFDPAKEIVRAFKREWQSAPFMSALDLRIAINRIIGRAVERERVEQNYENRGFPKLR